jgi:hypothetical protein
VERIGNPFSYMPILLVAAGRGYTSLASFHTIGWLMNRDLVPETRPLFRRLTPDEHARLERTRWHAFETGHRLFPHDPGESV